MSRKSFNWSGRRLEDPSHDLVVAFLTMDIQSDPVAARDLLLAIELVTTGAQTSWRRIGNLFDVKIDGELVFIEDIYEENRSSKLPLPEFAEAAQAWCDYVGC